MSFPADHPEVLRLLASGQAVDVTPRPPRAAESGADPERDRRTKRVASSSAVRLTLVLGVECPSLANLRDWKEKARAGKAQRQAIRRFFQERPAELLPLVQAVAAGRIVGIVLTRLGGRTLDGRDNLPMSLKPVVDELHAWFGLDDATDTLVVSYTQEPGGAVGIRIQMECLN